MKNDAVKRGDKMIISNGDFIHGCEWCGKDALVASEITLKFNYGSKYDGEMLTLNICGDCADKIFEQLFNGNKAKSVV